SAAELLGDPAAYESMSQAANPYGDGRASHRIAEVLLHHFRGKPRPADWGGHA
ncbi:MAG: UDP-N-acetylglucosamine 2-epimerase (non-hydrolyzing), partial [Armatimonadetes bacterium CG_4_8_14_3_um_filter_66_20]